MVQCCSRKAALAEQELLSESKVLNTRNFAWLDLGLCASEGADSGPNVPLHIWSALAVTCSFWDADGCSGNTTPRKFQRQQMAMDNTWLWTVTITQATMGISIYNTWVHQPTRHLRIWDSNIFRLSRKWPRSSFRPVGTNDAMGCGCETWEPQHGAC